jgi:ubiquitin-protein ligase
MLSDPNDESPANLEAAVPLVPMPLLCWPCVLECRSPALPLLHQQKQWREDKAGFKKKVQQCVRRSQEML